MGIIELRKFDSYLKFDNGKIKTNRPIDWNKTLELWYEDEESYKNKTLIKMEEKEMFKIYYNKSTANYNNRAFYEFIFNKDLKVRLKHKIKEGVIDAPLLKRKERLEW
jgi:asparagine N-glycosylation enzyme membrane subunit Stt3